MSIVHIDRMMLVTPLPSPLRHKVSPGDKVSLSCGCFLEDRQLLSKGFNVARVALTDCKMMFFRTSS